MPRKEKFIDKVVELRSIDLENSRRLDGARECQY